MNQSHLRRGRHILFTLLPVRFPRSPREEMQDENAAAAASSPSNLLTCDVLDVIYLPQPQIEALGIFELLLD